MQICMIEMLLPALPELPSKEYAAMPQLCQQHVRLQSPYHLRLLHTFGLCCKKPMIVAIVKICHDVSMLPITMHKLACSMSCA